LDRFLPARGLDAGSELAGFCSEIGEGKRTVKWRDRRTGHETSVVVCIRAVDVSFIASPVLVPEETG